MAKKPESARIDCVNNASKEMPVSGTDKSETTNKKQNPENDNDDNDNDDEDDIFAHVSWDADDWDDSEAGEKSTGSNNKVGHNPTAYIWHLDENHHLLYTEDYELLPTRELRLSFNLIDGDMKLNFSIPETRAFTEEEAGNGYSLNSEYNTFMPVGETYPITSVSLYVGKFNIQISKNIKEISFPYKEYNSTECYFDVDDDNEVYCSVNGSLLSKDKKILYFLHIQPERSWNEIFDVIIPKEVKQIRPYAIWTNKEDTAKRNIIFPSGITTLKANVVNGKFVSIVFKGHLTTVEDDAFENVRLYERIYCKNAIVYGLYINSTISDINIGNNSWDTFGAENVFFSAPEPQGKVDTKSGLLELSRVIPSKQKVAFHEDYAHIYINPYSLNLQANVEAAVNSNGRYHSEEGVLSAVEEIEVLGIYENKFGEPVKGSRLIFANNREIIIDVLESPETVNRLIGEALELTKKNS